MSITASSLIAQVKVEGDTETKQKLGEVSASVDKAGGVIGGLKGAFSGAFAWVSEGGLSNVISAFDTVRTSVGGLLQSAGDFQSSMTSLSTGAGELSSNLGLVSAGVLKTAVDTGTATSDLSAGLYLIDSAGQKGAQSLTTLTAAAEGAKVGTASLADVANGVTTEMTDYASTGLTAAAATNTLITAVSEGKTHMGELSQAMSTILPTSAALHVSLDDTAGAMATMTGEGTDAASAATYLRQLLMALESPAKAGASALKDIGLTTGEVAAEMRVSLPDTLKMIMDAMAKTYTVGSPQYVEALKNIAGGSKQMEGILELTGSHLSTFGENVKGVTDAVNKGGTSIIGWDKVQDDFNFKLEKAHEVVETLGIKIGTVLLPVAAKLLDIATPLVTQFSDWVGSLDQVGVAFQQAGRPIQQVQEYLAPLTDTFDHATGAIHTVSTALTPLTDTFDRAKGVIGSTTVATKPLLDSFDRATVIIPKVTTFITKTTEATSPLVALFVQWKPVIVAIASDVETLAGDVVTFATGIADAAEKSGLFQAVIQLIHDVLPDVGSSVVGVGGDINTNLLPPLESLVTNVGSAAAGFITWADKSGVAKTTLDTLGASIQLTAEILGPLIQAVSDVVGWLGGGGAGTDTLVFALSAAATAFTLLKIADTTAQFGSFIGKLQEGDGIITNLASSVKDKLAKAFDDFLSSQAPHIKQSLDDMKTSASDAATAEEKVGETASGDMAAGVTAGATESEASLTGIETKAGEVEAAEAGIGTTAETTMAEGISAGSTESESSLAGIGIAAETSAGEVAVSSTEMEGSLAGVGTAATGAEGSIAAVGTSAATAGAGVVSGFGVVAAGIMTAGIAAIVGIEAYMLKDATPALVNSWNNADFKEPPPFRTAAAQMNYDSYNAAHHISSNFSDMNKNVQGSFDQMNTKSVAAVQTLSDRAMAILDKLNQEGSGQMSALDDSSKGYWNDLADWIANNPINAVINIDENPINSQGKYFSPTQLKDYRKNAYASGTDYVPQTGTYLVGEQGPERVVLPQGAKVIPNDQLSRGGASWGSSGWGGGGSNQPMHVHVHIADQEFEYLTSAMMDNATRQTRLRHARRAY